MDEILKGCRQHGAGIQIEIDGAEMIQQIGNLGLAEKYPLHPEAFEGNAIFDFPAYIDDGYVSSLDCGQKRQYGEEPWSGSKAVMSGHLPRSVVVPPPRCKLGRRYPR